MRLGPRIDAQVLEAHAELAGDDAFGELVRLAVAKDGTLAASPATSVVGEPQDRLITKCMLSNSHAAKQLRPCATALEPCSRCATSLLSQSTAALK